MTALGYREIILHWLQAEAFGWHSESIAHAIQSGVPERWWAEQRAAQHKCEYKPTATGRQFVCVCGAIHEAP